ncbi:nitrate ABC transporter substrate-binding protein [Mycobacterium sp. MS1601]|uniref:nitrate ABC transporter substrate-binding protein n=1 Tax=Mycobacterium sp. MS1601 TaxID=1936029 RepID=UPI001F2C7224|nr:nitrate ABC transporter substrate-binding protein [Mycobacterium sp. MS1601]
MKVRPARRIATVLASAALLTPLAACGGSAESPSDSAAGIPTATGDHELASACGDDVAIQLQWQPQSDMGALFELLGEDYQVDTEAKSVTGALVFDGADTGVDLTLKAGGPAIGFQSVSSQMYVDDNIDLGLVHGDELIAAAAAQPVVGVTPLLKYTPQMLMWDPASYGEDLQIPEINGLDAPVVVASGTVFSAWLVDKGFVRSDQIDTSYDGNPSRFVGDTQIIQQGFANSEPYTYEFDTPAWGRKVSFQLLKDAGYNIYASNLSVRRDRLEEMAPCLEKLVPMVQQASVDYLADPAPANAKIVDVVAQDPSMSPYSDGEAEYSARYLADAGLIGPEADGSVGTYDFERVDSFVAELAPVLRSGGADVPQDVSGKQLFTDRFADHSIGMD